MNLALRNYIPSKVHRGRDFFDDFFGDLGLYQEPYKNGFYPRVNVTENEEKLIFEAEVPGLSRDQIKVELEDGVLTFTGEKTTTENKDLKHSEFSYGKFSRSFKLNTDVIDDQLEARLNEGILTVTLPKSQKAQAKVIDIK